MRRRRLCRIDHLRAVPATLCRGGEELASCRHLRLDAVGQTGASRRRRMPGRARDLQTAERTLWMIRVSRRPGRRSPPGISRARSRRRASSRARSYEVVEAVAPLRREPAPDAMLETQALKGERVTIYDHSDEGWAWGQLNGDGYVGWLPDRALGKRPAPRRRTRSLPCGRLRFPDRRSNCRRSRRCRSAPD